MKVPAKLVNANTEAVSLILQGNLAESLRIIRMTLGDLNQIMKDEENAASPDANMVDTNTAMAATDKDMIDSVTVSSDTQTLSNAHFGVFHFFNRALVLDVPRAVGEESHVVVDHYKISAVLLYNAGLCSHIRGIHSGSSRDLSTALHFYRYSFSLLTDTNALQAVDDRDSLLVMALLNNMGHINAQSCDHQASKVCLETMRRVFSSTGGAALEEADSLFFYLTSFLVPVEHLCATPAA